MFCHTFAVHALEGFAICWIILKVFGNLFLALPSVLRQVPQARVSFLVIVGLSRLRSWVTFSSFSLRLADSRSRINSDATRFTSGSEITPVGVTISLISRSNAAVVSSPFFSRA